MKLELEPKDLDTIAEKVTERLLPHLGRTGSNPMEKRLYSIREAAHILGRGTWAIRHMVAEGKLPCIRDGKRIFIERKALESWIAAHSGEI